LVQVHGILTAVLHTDCLLRLTLDIVVFIYGNGAGYNRKFCLVGLGCVQTYQFTMGVWVWS